jgi:hypothetical protein
VIPQKEQFDTKKYELMPQKIFDDILFGKDPLSSLDLAFTMPPQILNNNKSNMHREKNLQNQGKAQY